MKPIRNRVGVGSSTVVVAAITAAVIVLVVLSLLLSSSIGLTALVDAKKSHKDSNNASNSNDNSNGVITKLSIAADSQSTGKPLTVEQAILGCPTDNDPNAPPALKPWCDKFMTFLTDYCLKHMTDPGAKESFQVCYDNSLMKDMMLYLIKHGITVNGKNGYAIGGEMVANSINAMG